MMTPWVSFNGKDCSGCKYLNERGYCSFTACIIPCTISATIPSVPKTNADRIRSMTDEELFDELIRIYNMFQNYSNSWMWLSNWLKEEVNDGFN